MRLSRLLTAAAMTLLLSAVTGCAAETPPVSQKVADYYNKNRVLATPTPTVTPPLSVPHGDTLRVLFSGDSLTVGRDASTPEKSFRSLMVASWEKAVPVEAASLAKSGRTTSEIYPMIQDDAGNHDLLVVELGTNDVYKSTPERFQVDYPKYLDAVRAASPQAALVCAGVWKRSAVQFAMDSTIETECTKRGGRFVPLSAFYGEAQYMSKPGIPHWDGAKTDGNHPNDAGHRKIADALLAVVSVK